MAATSFGHVTTNEIFPPGINPANPSPLNTSIGYQPITGSIFDLLDANKVTWFNYFEDLPTSVIFRGNHVPFLVAHARIGVFPLVPSEARVSSQLRPRYSAAVLVRRSIVCSRPGDQRPRI